MQLRAMEPHEIDEVDTLIRAAFLTAPVTDGSEQDLIKRLRSSTGYLPEQELVALDDDRIVGHILMILPVLVRPEVMSGTGFLGEHAEEIYYLERDDLYLVRCGYW